MTALLKHRCPSCGKMLRIEERHLKGLIRCPGCQHTFEPFDAQQSSQHSVDLNPAAISVDTIVNAQLETREDGQDQTSIDRTEQPLRRLGRFELRRVLGQGGFGRVYLAFDPQLERDVALKVLTTGPKSQVRVQRFITEAKAAARLKHPNIVPTFESGKEENRYYIASEFIEGRLLSDESLRATLDHRGVVDCVRKLATALAYAHENKVVHRDLKPQNVIMDSQGDPHLMDFGLARRTDEESNLTTDGAMLGTPAYMSPEQARGDFANVGPQSDQYSLGVILYQFLTGQTPFDGLPHLVVTQVAKGEVPPIRSVRPDVPADVAAVCEKAMQKLPGDRYLSCQEFADDLAAWLNGMPVAARPLNAVQQAIRFVGQHSLIASMTSVTLCLFAVLGVCVWQLFGGPENNLAASQTSLQIQTNLETATDSAPGQRGVPDTTDSSIASTPDTAEPTAATTTANLSADAVLQEVPASAPVTTPAVSEIDAGIASLLGESSDWEWGSPEPAVGIAEAGLWTPTISMDGLTLAVAADRNGGLGTADIWVSRRKTLTDPWPELINPGPGINCRVSDWSPSLSADGRTLYFHSHRPGGRDGNIWVSKWDEAENKWTDAIKLPASVNTTGIEQQPAISPDGLEMIVWSNGPASRAGGELWQHRRQDISEPFGDGVKVREASPTLKDLNLLDILFYSPDSLSAVFSIHGKTHGKPESFILCSRSTSDAPWENQRSVTALPNDSYDVTYSSAAKLILLHRGNSSSLWQMQLVPTESESSAVGASNLPDAKPSEPKKDETTSTLSSTEIDLLNQINPAECSIYGTWTRVAGGVQSPKMSTTRLQIPWVAEGDYDLTVIAKPIDKVDALAIGLNSGGHQFHVLLNFGGGFAALEQVDGLDVGNRPGPGKNPTAIHKPNLMATNKESTIVCRVRKTGVTVDVDGVNIIDWKGNPDRLSRNSYWASSLDQSMFIGILGCQYEISKIELKPITGTVKEFPPPRLISARSLQLASAAFDVPLNVLEELQKTWSISVNDRLDGELALEVWPRSLPIQDSDILPITTLTCPVHVTLYPADSNMWSDETMRQLAATPLLRKLNVNGKEQLPARHLSILSTCQSLRYLILDYQLLDETKVAEIGKIKSLHRLQLNFTDLNDASVALIAESQPDLKLLHIGHMGKNSKLTNAAVTSVSQLRKLTDFSIRESPAIDDQCIPDLAKLKTLTALYIDGTAITNSGYARLRSQLPNTQITWTPAAKK